VSATPEYNGGLSSVMKAVIENLEQLAGKPVALLGVAAGAIGAIKSLEMLRSIASHAGAVVLPQAVSIAGVQNKFSADGQVLDAAAGAIGAFRDQPGSLSRGGCSPETRTSEPRTSRCNRCRQLSYPSL